MFAETKLVQEFDTNFTNKYILWVHTFTSITCV